MRFGCIAFEGACRGEGVGLDVEDLSCATAIGDVGQ